MLERITEVLGVGGVEGVGVGTVSAFLGTGFLVGSFSSSSFLRLTDWMPKLLKILVNMPAVKVLSAC